MQIYLQVALLINFVFCAHSQNPHFFDILRKSQCQNMDDVMNGLGWNDKNVNPYVTNPHGVDIPRDQQCYATVTNPSADFEAEAMTYVLHDMTADEAAVYNQTSGGHTYMTHNYTCAACSSLADLRVYLQTPDLTTPVKDCTMKTVLEPWLSKAGAFKKTSDCIAKTVGFSEMCSDIWVYNTQNTRAHCQTNCIIQEEILHLPNNVPKQRFDGIADTNYCDPTIC